MSTDRRANGPTEIHSLSESFRLASLSRRVFALLFVLQALSLFLLWNGHGANAVSEGFLCLQNAVALSLMLKAARRARGDDRVFWALLSSAFLLWLITNLAWLYQNLTQVQVFSDPVFRLLYRSYGAPVLMALFLRDQRQSERIDFEVFLDFFQVFLVVGFAFFAVLYLPVREMLPRDALLRGIQISNLENLILLLCVAGRFAASGERERRSLYGRLLIFVGIYSVVTFAGNYLETRLSSAVMLWFDLCWAVPYIVGGWLAVTWQPSPESETRKTSYRTFAGFLLPNLVLVFAVLCVHSFSDSMGPQWHVVGTSAVAFSFLALALRFSITQLRQQHEILQRESSQESLARANQRIGVLLQEATAQTRDVTRISELGSWLQACSAKEEAYRVVSEKVPEIFPKTSGVLSVINASRNRVEAVAEWGPSPPADKVFPPSECWALRRGCTHYVPDVDSALSCVNLKAHGAATCVPMVANGETIGVLALQETTPDNGEGRREVPNRLAQTDLLVSAVAEHIALALSNLNLREALRTEAIHDPLTGLYNRRYMQEFLEREIHRALRRDRPLSVMMLDLDHFKHYNDTFGHRAGDELLRAVGEFLLHNVRSEDIACRYGGEEFVLILPECTAERATQRADQLREALKHIHSRAPRVAHSVTVSIGVARLSTRVTDAESLLGAADNALYQAKREGRDRVVMLNQSVQEA
jgi:diguanylate cyclase (GGDEF)-like protein